LEQALSLGLERTQRAYEAHRTAMDWMLPLFSQASRFALDSAAMESRSGAAMRRFLAMGRRFQRVVDDARAAPPPAGYDSAQTFFYLAKLVQELTPSVEARVVEILTEGLGFAETQGLGNHADAAAMREMLGQSLFATAHCFEFLSRRALIRPPIPAGLAPAQRKPFEKKFEEMGFALQDQAIRAQRALVESASKGLAGPDWAARAFAALLLVEPDRWQTPAENGAEPKLLYPWSGQPATQAELDSLRQTPFTLPNFGA
jgi:hypothetical protein